MNVFAYCAQSFAVAVENAAGVMPITCPPTTADNFDLKQMIGRDLLYFDLHGLPGRGEWYGDYGLVALRANQLVDLDLKGTVVFAVNCYLGDSNSPMLDALLVAGAKYIIAAPDENYAGQSKVEGAELLGEWFRRMMQIGFDPLKALALAKLRVKASGLLSFDQRRMVVHDTLGFRAFYRKEATA